MKKITATGVILLLLLASTTLSARSAALGSLEAVFLNVGQGDAMLLRDAGGFNVLIDGGETDAGPTVVSYLRDHGIGDIDVLVATHPDSDHIGGLIDVLQATDIAITELLYNGYPGSSVTWDDFLAAAAARGLTPTSAQFPAEFSWGEMTVHVLNPPAGLASSETNDASIVLRVDHGAINFLFTGDISSPVEADVLARGTPVAAEVLKVAHHGSAYGSSADFLSAVDPDNSIIEVGDNDYNHPAEETLARLSAAGSAVWRTDLNGHVTVVSDGAGYSITAETALLRIFLPLAAREMRPPAPTTGTLRILAVFYDGAGSSEPDEYVEIQNADGHAIDVQGWTLRDESGKTYTFPAFTMQPAQVCRVYTNESHPETCGFNYQSGQPVWNNSGDCAHLRDAAGAAVDSRCY